MSGFSKFAVHWLPEMNITSSQVTRRHALQAAACGFGWLALRGLAAENPLAPRVPHFAPRAKRVIFLFMRGGPSQVDSFDYKPALTRRHGEALGGGRKYWQSPWEFMPHGQCGLPVSSLFPNLAKHADKLCVLKVATRISAIIRRQFCKCLRGAFGLCGRAWARG